MNPAHQTITKQRPGRPPNQEYTGDVLAMPDGTIRKVRIVQVGDMKLRAPEGIVRANVVSEKTAVNYSRWMFKSKGIRIAIPDLSGTPAESLVKAVDALLQLYDAPVRVIQEYKRKLTNRENQSKNINTGIQGIDMSGRFKKDTRTVDYVLRYRVTLPNGDPFHKGFSVTKSNMTDFAKKMSMLIAMRDAVENGAMNTKLTCQGYWKMIKNGLVRGPNIVALPPVFHQQWKDNETMQLSRGRGDGWTDPYTGEEV